MAYEKWNTGETSPIDWLVLVMDKMEFDKAFQVLDKYTHFHSSTLRGKVLMLQMRPENAFEHFDRAEEKFKKINSPTEREQILAFYLHVYKFDGACYLEGLDPTEENCHRTDNILKNLLEFECPKTALIEQIRIFNIANYQMIRGEYHSALTTYENLITESQYRMEDHRVGFFCGAAVCASELNLSNEAERQYQNAALSTNLLSKNFKCCVFYARLYFLLMHWQRNDEAQEWKDRIENMNCPRKSKDYFIHRAQGLSKKLRKSKHIYLC